MWNRSSRVLLIFLFVFGMWFMFEPITVNACSCGGTPSIEDQMNRRTAIFTGKVLSLTQPKPVIGELSYSSDPVKVLFEVKTVWKGELNSHTTVFTAMSEVSCGYEGFEVNKDYIVFAYGDPNRLETGLCEGTKILTSAKKELNALGPGYKPTNLTFPQEVPIEISSINKETNNRYDIIVLVLLSSLTLIFLIVISIRRRRRL
jgi:hypothetical protein